MQHKQMAPRVNPAHLCVRKLANSSIFPASFITSCIEQKLFFFARQHKLYGIVIDRMESVWFPRVDKSVRFTTARAPYEYITTYSYENNKKNTKVIGRAAPTIV